MRAASAALVLGVGLLAGGCIDVGINSTIDHDVQFQLGNLDGKCQGGGTISTSDGMTVYTETAATDPNTSAQLCRIDVTWSGTLVDTQPIHDKVAEEAKKNGKSESDLDLTITKVELTASDVALTDAMGNNVTPPLVPSWQAEIDTSAEPVVQMMGSDLTQLLAMPTTTTLSAASVKLINDDYKSKMPVSASGTASLSVDMSDLAELINRDLRIKFHIEAVVNGSAKVSL